MLGRMRGGLDERRRADLIARFDLDPTKKGRTYSKGNRQKVALVAALSCDVPLYLLDEPTSGLDPLMESVFRDCVAEIRGSGRTILLSSHILSEVEKLADRVSIIRAGRIVESGTLAAMRHLHRTHLEAELRTPPSSVAEIAGMPGVVDAVLDGDRISLAVDTDDLAGVLGALGHYGIRSLVSQPPTLEELFLSTYETAEGAAR